MALPNFPPKPTRSYNSQTFPSDLIQANRNFYAELQFISYNGGYGGAPTAGGTIKIPLPRRINDNEFMLWQEWSGTEGAINSMSSFGSAPIASAMAAAQYPLQLLGVQNGVTLNPWMWLMFKRPGFKEFTFQWTLAPNSQAESDRLNQIIKACKTAALPPAPDGLLQNYPDLVQVTLHPEQYLFKLKPCAIISVQVDYTGSGQPSFFKSGAPTIVNLTLQLKETKLWSKDDMA